MVNHKTKDAARPQAPVAPKRKRLGSEQERRERKRAIDREAQRSLREKTKTRIAELERTVELLRDTDRNQATASLLSEIDALRAENRRLKEIVDSVRSIVGSNVACQNVVPAGSAYGQGSENNSPPATDVDQSSTQLRTDSIGSDAQLSPPAHVDQLTATHYPTFVNKQTYHGQPDALQRPTMVRAIDLDGMNIMTDDAHQLVTPETDELANSDPDEVVVPYVNGHVDMNLEFQPLTKHTPEQQAEQSLASAFRSATWTSMMGEVFPLPQPPSQTAPSFLSPDRPPEPISISQVFGTDWHCPSPTVLHIDYSQHLTIPMSGATCPKWKRSNEILSKIFTSRCSGTNAVKPIKDNTEASFLYLCIKHGWNSMSPDQWMQSPTLSIIKQLDDLLFSHQSNTKRFAIAYAILKLLKFYLNATKEELDKVPSWLRPSPLQASTPHPIAIDFFAWPTLRLRLLSHHPTIYQSDTFATCFPRCLRFSWPFAFEDMFSYRATEEDEEEGGEGRGRGGVGIGGKYIPTPLFERYHRDLEYWTLDEPFFDVFPEMRGDVEGDRKVFGERSQYV